MQCRKVCQVNAIRAMSMWSQGLSSESSTCKVCVVSMSVCSDGQMRRSLKDRSLYGPFWYRFEHGESGGDVWCVRAACARARGRARARAWASACPVRCCACAHKLCLCGRVCVCVELCLSACRDRVSDWWASMFRDMSRLRVSNYVIVTHGITQVS